MTFSSFEQARTAARQRLGSIDFASLEQTEVYRDPLNYYLLANYPPLKAMREISPEEVFRNARGPQRIYLHIPFCEQYCTFCHYAKEIRAREDRIERYLRALFDEMDRVFERLGEAIPTFSIFFGGGTPSSLSPQQLDRLFVHLGRGIERRGGADVIFELHPGVIRQDDYEERIRVLREHGVTRWVFGVQTMDPVILAKLNRGHGPEEVHGLLEILDRHGQKDVSLDLIYGLPHQTLRGWYDSLVTLVEAGVEKFNIFPLMFKPSDPIWLHYQKEPHIFPRGEERRLMHFLAEHVLFERGFSKGPLLYYSKGKHAYRPLRESPPEESIEGLGLVAFGVSAFGYLGHTQYFNHCDMSTYLETCESGRLPTWRGFTLDLDERMRRAMMLGLRSRGVSRSDFESKFGRAPREVFPEALARLEQLGLLETRGDELHLTIKGEVDAAGAVSIFCSDAVRERIRETNRSIENPRRSLLERHDFSPIEHSMVEPAASLPTPPSGEALGRNEA